jgi:hypothetical protein
MVFRLQSTNQSINVELYMQYMRQAISESK